MKHSIKEVVKKQLEYCEAIKSDILKNKGSMEIICYAKGFAEIESPMTKETTAEWIRIQFGGIYIFIPLDIDENDEDFSHCQIDKNGRIEYNLDFLCEYGGELIVAFSKEEFLELLNEVSDKDIEETYPFEWNEKQYKEEMNCLDYIPM